MDEETSGNLLMKLFKALVCAAHKLQGNFSGQGE